jgi:hypothetical protein
LAILIPHYIRIPGTPYQSGLLKRGEGRRGRRKKNLVENLVEKV